MTLISGLLQRTRSDEESSRTVARARPTYWNEQRHDGPSIDESNRGQLALLPLRASAEDRFGGALR